MNFVAKIITQVLISLLPKIIDMVKKFFISIQQSRKLKKYKEEAAKKMENYENASVESANDSFNNLP